MTIHPDHKPTPCNDFISLQKLMDNVKANTGDGSSERPKIRAAYREVQRFYSDIVLKHDSDECLLWPFSINGGYPHMRISGTPSHVHRMLCEFVHGPAPTDKHEAAHSCGNGRTMGCVAKKHLSWKTRSENELDKVIHGTVYSPLSNDQVLEIKALLDVYTDTELGDKFGVKRRSINRIRHGKRWSRLVPPNPKLSPELGV